MLCVHDSQAEINTVIDMLISGTEFLVWLLALASWSLFSSLPFPFKKVKPKPKNFLSSRCRITEWNTQDVKGAETSSTRACLAFSLNAEGTWFSLSIQAGRQRWAARGGWSGSLWITSNQITQFTVITSYNSFDPTPDPTSLKSGMGVCAVSCLQVAILWQEMTRWC